MNEPLAALRLAQHPTCVVCGAAHPTGLRVAFSPRDDGGVQGTFQGDPSWEGYHGLLHGGVLGALLDGAMTNCLFAHGISAVTAELNVRYLECVPVGRRLEISAWLVRTRGRVHVLQAEIRQDDRIAARASAKFMDRRHLSNC